MGDNQVVVEMTADEARMFRALSRVEAENDNLKRKVKELETGFNAAGAAGENAMSRVEKATSPAAKQIWEEDRAIKATKKSWEEHAQAAENAQKVGTGAAQAIATSAAAAIAGYVTLREAVKLAADEIRNLQAVQAKAADANISEVGAENELIRNMPGGNIPRAMAASDDIAKRRSQPSSVIKRALASAMSASGGNLEGSISAVDAAAEMLPDMPSEIPMYAGAMLDLAKLTGTQDATVNRGLLAFVGGMHRNVNPAQLAQHVPKALIGVSNYGGSTAEATALVAALSMASGDIEGRESGTGSVRLAEQLRSFLPETGMDAVTKKEGLSDSEQLARTKLLQSSVYRNALSRKNAGESLSDEQLRALKKEEVFAKREAGETTQAARPAMGGFGARLDYLQANPELARQFIAESSFEAKMAGPIEQLLLNPNSVAATEYRKNLGLMPGLDPMSRRIMTVGMPDAMAGLVGDAADQQARMGSLRQIGNDTVSKLNTGPRGALEQQSRAWKNGVLRLMLNNLGGAEGGINREGLSETLQASGAGALATKVNMMDWEWNSKFGRVGGTKEAISVLEQRRDALMNPQEVMFPDAIGNNGGTINRAPTNKEINSATILNDVVLELKKLNAQTAANRPLVGKPDQD